MTVIHQAVCDGLLDENHCREFLSLYVKSHYFRDWITTERLQQEVLEELIGRPPYRSRGVLPTIKKVRNTVKRWNAMIQAAESACDSLPEDDPTWRTRFVALLAKDHVRTEAGINQALNAIISLRRQHERDTAKRLESEIHQRRQQEQLLEKAQLQTAYLAGQSSKLLHGDARKLMAEAPDQFRLLLTDPPYGMRYQSQPPDRDAPKTGTRERHARGGVPIVTRCAVRPPIPKWPKTPLA